MQIRTRNGNIEFLRSTYDSEKKRSSAKLIKPEDFTPEEKAQFSAYTAGRESEARKATICDAARHPAYYLKAVIDGLNAGHKPTDEAAFWAVYDDLKKAIKRSKMKRPKVEVSAVSEEK